MEVPDLIANVVASTLRLATPLILAGMAGLLSYRVGLINIALEGLMLVGAFCAVVIGFQAGSAWVGVLSAVAICAALGALFTLLTTDLRANLIITGLAFNFLALGATAYLLQSLYGTSGTFAPSGFTALQRWQVPLLAEIPYVGRVFFQHSPLVYLSWVAIPLTAIFLYRTYLGVHLRAVGENTEAAVTAGISARRVRYLALILGGALCGLAGAHLAVSDLALFRENMTGGRGFIALAAVYFAAGRPVMTAFACVLFGFFEAAQFRLQTVSNTPPQFFQMLPYLMVVVMLVIVSIRQEMKKGTTA